MSEPRNNTGLTDEILIECLEIASAQRKRAATNFKPGSAAKNELLTEAASIDGAKAAIMSAPTPLEAMIARKK